MRVRLNTLKKAIRGRTLRTALLWALGVVSVVDLGLGCLLVAPLAIGGGAAGLAYAAWRLANIRRSRSAVPADTRRAEHQKNHESDAGRPTRPTYTADPNDTEALVKQMLSQGRYALLLRPQIAANLSPQTLAEVRESLFEAMTLVPEGEVVLGQIDDALDDGALDEDEIAQYHGRVVRVEQYLLDRYAVTNGQYYEFVAAGGYGQMALWDESIWPAVLDFRDRTGQPGPRYWRDGCYLPGRENHPVVGVCWFEAQAFARWAGKRLPSGAEWVKAGAWPSFIDKLASARVQRRYPWGETMDRSRVNLWGSGPGDTVPVHALAEGVSVGGVHQLIGNVWEWTAGDFRGEAPGVGPLVLDVPMKSIRGGAFDTYFDNQATCHFQSGEAAVGRKHNIGFRTAVGVCDLMLTAAAPAPAEEPLAAEAEEVQV